MVDLTIANPAGGFLLAGTLASLNIFNVITGSANFAISRTTADISFAVRGPRT